MIELTGDRVRFIGPTWEAIAGLQAKIAKALLKMPILERDGRNQFHGFPYTTYDEAASKLRLVLARSGLSFTASVSTWAQAPLQTGWHSTVDVEIVLGDAETGAIGIFGAIGEANDKQDKGLNKALTGAIKYWLMRALLSVSRQDGSADPDDPDAESGEGELSESSRQAEFEKWLQDEKAIDPADFYRWLDVPGFAQIRMSNAQMKEQIKAYLAAT